MEETKRLDLASKKAWYKSVLFLLLFVFPAALLGVSYYLDFLRGNFWLYHNFHPEYPFLFNSLSLATGRSIEQINYPGTPLQILVSALIRIIFVIRQPAVDMIQKDLLSNPEIYLLIISRLITGMNILAILAVGIFTYKITGSIWDGLALQSAPFLSIYLINYCFARVTPESLLFLCGIFYSVLFILVSKSDTNKSNPQLAVLLATAWGFGTACKLTFFPLIIIPLIVLYDFRERIFFLFCACLSFLIFTIPIIPKYKAFFFSLKNNPLTVDTGISLSGLSNTFADNHFLVFAVLFSLMALIIVLLKKSKKSWKSSNFKALLGLTLANISGILVFSIDYHPYYLIPELSLMGLNIYLLINLAGEISSSASAPFKVFAIFVFLAIAGYNAFVELPILFSEKKFKKEKSMEFYSTVKNNFKDFINVTYYKSSSPLFALYYGNSLSGQHYSKELEEIYGQVYFYNLSDKIIEGWGKGISDKYFNKYFISENILLRGTSFDKTEDPAIKNGNLTEVIKDEFESAYRIKNKNDDFMPE